MKKFSISLIAICLMWTGNALAQPDCGVWIAGPGNYEQIVDTDLGFRTSNPSAVIKYKNLCGSGGSLPWMYKARIVPDTCDEHTVTGVRAVPNMMGNPGWIEQYPDPLSPAVQQYGDTVQNYYVLAHNIRAESSVPSTIGTMKFYDFRGYCPVGCPLPSVYTADVIKYDVKYSPMYCPGTYISSSGAGTNCAVDMTSQPTANPCSMHWEVVQEGQVTSGWDQDTSTAIPITTYTTVKFWSQGWADIPNLTPGPNGFEITGFMQQMRIEVDQPLRHDANGDGVVDGLDFFTFRSEYFGTDPCGCANYWPGISMP